MSHNSFETQSPRVTALARMRGVRAAVGENAAPIREGRTSAAMP
ncbi:hypothetical protein [Halostagnicola kamekurae]|nr:hypothetical protein [Halostagnicola kamekurae]